MRIGIIGLGKMGWPIAENIYHFLQNNKFRINNEVLDSIIVYDIDNSIVNKFIEHHPGSVAAKNLEELGGESYLVWLMIPSSEVYDTLINSGLLRGMKKGIIIDGGNSDPRVSLELSKLLRKRNIRFMDIGCSGGPERAKKAELTLMVGGSKEDYEKIKPILKALGKPYYVGPTGMGHLVKMLHNVLEYIIMGGIGEIYMLLRFLSQKLISKEIDVVRAMKAINDGLAGSKLLKLAIEILELNSSIEKIAPYVAGGKQAEWTIDMAREIPTIFTDLALLQRKISRDEDYSDELNKLIRDIEKLKEKPLGMFEIQALLREKFGGHEVKYRT